jgi:ferritin-like metal-binding protein YciE
MHGLEELFLSELGDIYDAEKQLVKALPKMAKAAQSEELRDAFESHLAETEGHVQRLEQAFEALGKPAKGRKCEAMQGLIKEGKEIISDMEDSTLDAGLICAAQKVEHYETAAYGCLTTWARLLDKRDVCDLLQQTLDEEKAADKKLTEIAESAINVSAVEEQSRLEERGGPRPRAGLHVD